jgi:hypothetical protein
MIKSAQESITQKLELHQKDFQTIKTPYVLVREAAKERFPCSTIDAMLTLMEKHPEGVPFENTSVTNSCQLPEKDEPSSFAKILSKSVSHLIRPFSPASHE